MATALENWSTPPRRGTRLLKKLVVDCGLDRSELPTDLEKRLLMAIRAIVTASLEPVRN